MVANGSTIDNKVSVTHLPVGTYYLGVGGTVFRFLKESN